MMIILHTTIDFVSSPWLLGLTVLSRLINSYYLSPGVRLQTVVSQKEAASYQVIIFRVMSFQWALTLAHLRHTPTNFNVHAALSAISVQDRMDSNETQNNPNPPPLPSVPKVGFGNQTYSSRSPHCPEGDIEFWLNFWLKAIWHVLKGCIYFIISCNEYIIVRSPTAWICNLA